MIEPGDIHNSYHVLKELGKGNFGKTFEVEDKWTNDHKVIKILTRSEDKAIKLFEQECDVLKRLNHPGIPKVEADGYVRLECRHTQEKLRGLVMEKIEGQDLEEWLEQNTRITNTTQAIEWLKQLTDILAHVHRHNYYHRDIKPSNIMLKPHGQLVLIDFGIVKEFIQKQTIPNSVIGTPGYNSPEQANRNEINHTSDFFSLGRTFVHLLTGICPEYNNLEEDVNRRLLWRDKAPGIDEKFKDLIDWLMEYRPRKRPQNIQDILQEIERIETQIKPEKIILPVPIVFLSFTLNLVLLTLLSMELKLDGGFKVLFLVVVCVIGGFLFKPLYKYLF
jgi:eukaryotic-like serine/threonine-protein kinase